MPSVLTHLILDVHDIERSLEFYHGLLCLPLQRQELWSGHRLAYLRTGQTELLLVQQPLDEQNPSLDRSGGLVLNFHVQDLRAIAGHVHEAHATVLRDLEDPDGGERTMLLADPDGYAVMLSEPVAPFT
jgi:lactoylglutathione lyase